MRGIVAKKIRRICFGVRQIQTVNGVSKRENWAALIMRMSQVAVPDTNKDGTESKTMRYAIDSPRNNYRGMKRLWHVTPRGAARNKLAYEMNLSEFWVGKGADRPAD
jgi:hypothetical protein